MVGLDKLHAIRHNLTMETGSDIVVQASAEDVVILNDTAQICKCENCGHEITISSGIVLDDQIRTLGANADITTCPSCGSSVQLPKPDAAVQLQSGG